MNSSSRLRLNKNQFFRFFYDHYGCEKEKKCSYVLTNKK